MKPHLFRAAASVTATAALVALPSATAQTLLAELGDAGPFGAIGEQVACAGDVDSDGVQDLLVAGRVGVFTFSGASGAELSFHDVETSVDGSAPLNILGLPDVDGDGAPDMLVASREELRAYSRDGGDLLWLFSTGRAGGLGLDLERVADLDGDDVDDLVASEQYASPNGVQRAGSIHVLSGATGASITQIDGSATFQEIGGTLAVLRDVDGDGVDELAFTDPDFTVRGEQVGRVVVVAANDGSPQFTIVSPAPAFAFADEMTGLGDVDGDDVDDLALAWIDGEGARHLHVRSGVDGSLVWASSIGVFGGLLDLGDVTGDGVHDLAAGSPGFLVFPSTAVVYDGTDGSQVTTLSASAGHFADLAAVGDLDGDLVPDLLAGSYPQGAQTPAPSALALSVGSATLVHAFTNTVGGQGLGRALDRGGDIDGDGSDDWIVLGQTVTQHYSGATFALLHEFALPPNPLGIFGGETAVVGLADVDDDGIPDHAAGNGTYGFSSFQGRVVLASGADGSVLAQRIGAAPVTGAEQYGLRLARAHDEDGDGLADLYVSVPLRQSAGSLAAGQVELVSGADLHTLRIVTGADQVQGRFGESLSSGHDLDLDGIPDLAVGSREESAGKIDAGRLTVLSGADGSVLLVVDGQNGSTLVTGALVGDATTDGIPDVLVTEATYKAPGETTARGRVRLVSGATGDVAWTVVGAGAADEFGRNGAGVGDVDGDGLCDVVVTSIPGTAGLSATVLSGADGSVLDAFDLDADSQLAGTAGIASGGLVDAGGCSEFIVGVPTAYGNGSARLYAASAGGDFGFIDEGHGLAGSHPVPPHLMIWGDLQGGASKSLAARRALPNKIAAWFLSVAEANVPFKGGILVPSPFVAFFVGIANTGPLGEIVILDTPTPLGMPPGVAVWHQFAFQDPLAPVGVSLSNGVQEIFKGD